MNVFGITDVGMKRSVNQDYIFISKEPIGKLPNLFIVADGMGGHKAGDYASKFAVTTFIELIKSSVEDNYISIMNAALQKMNKELFLKACSNIDFEGMGTTFVAAVLDNNELYVLNVGDSRLYIAGQQITQITRDHSWVEEMVAKGELLREEARNHSNKNWITRAVGSNPEVMADFFEVSLHEDERILLCSDGLSNMLEDSEIYEFLGQEDTELSQKVKNLVDKANDNGGKDNISVILIEPDRI